MQQGSTCSNTTLGGCHAGTRGASCRQAGCMAERPTCGMHEGAQFQVCDVATGMDSCDLCRHAQLRPSWLLGCPARRWTSSACATASGA